MVWHCDEIKCWKRTFSVQHYSEILPSFFWLSTAVLGAIIWEVTCLLSPILPMSWVEIMNPRQPLFLPFLTWCLTLSFPRDQLTSCSQLMCFLGCPERSPKMSLNVFFQTWRLIIKVWGLALNSLVLGCIILFWNAGGTVLHQDEEEQGSFWVSVWKAEQQLE